MTGLDALADALSLQLGRVASFEEEDERRGRRITGSSVGRTGSCEKANVSVVKSKWHSGMPRESRAYGRAAEIFERVSLRVKP
ncbi:MAG: hypothetical protein ACRCWF_07445 [Beijerinckiaceae bacterium]